MQISKEYQGYFSDDKLTKSDRKNKLIAASKSIAAEREKMSKCEEPSYEMDVALNESVSADFIQKCMVCDIWWFFYE